ncbi:hypothetical protein [Fangia hongkongensis]|nr:hypothetical protein [Fangia hongkongensis]MBK2123828.1 hypothetical protein [Fangia hongkongensis]
MYRFNPKQKGATLIQLLVGLAVAAFVILMVERMYFVLRAKYYNNVSALEENTKALELSQAIRSSIDDATTPSSFGMWPWQIKTLRVPGESFNPLNYPPVYAATSLTNLNLSSQVSGTDILLIQGVLASETTTSVIMSSSTSVNIPTNMSIGSSDYVLLADDSGYELMKSASNSTGSSVTVTQGPSRDFAIGSYLAHYQTLVFYLYQDGADEDVYLLTDNAASGDELLQKIEDFQIEYYLNGAWSAVSSETTSGYVDSWYKEVKGIRVSYSVNGKAYTAIVAIKQNNL